ncbi:DUF1385 domain-containing protein [Candidatus Woesearchaeota archaeon]|nr:DUF1385 domain-containing protein [Candidatus Woesearchaeota archaeon]
MTKKHTVGGQAIVEGVLMKNSKSLVMAVRKKNNEIKTKKRKIQNKKYPPVIRGLVNLIDMLKYGFDAIIWSSKEYYEDEEQISKAEIFTTVALSAVFSIVLFVAAPYYITILMRFSELLSPLVFNLVDSLVKIVFFIVFLVIISSMKDIRRTFEYHGAEHKVVNCYEHGEKLTVKNVKKYSTLHPRCGTAFIMIIFLVSILVFSFYPLIITAIWPDFILVKSIPRRMVLFTLRIISIPLIAGISYEFLKFTADKKDERVFASLILPGLLLQKLTTREPDNRQIEVAVKALKELIS